MTPFPSRLEEKITEVDIILDVAKAAKKQHCDNLGFLKL